jgi:hypothetical protein
MSQSHSKEEKKETKAEIEARVQEKARLNAERLGKSVASLISQAHVERKRRDEFKREYDQKQADLKNAGESELKYDEKDLPTLIVHPAIMYGYDAQGSGLKKSVGRLQEIVGEIKEEKKEEGEEGEEREEKSFSEKVKQFEENVRNIQNGWMVGRPVDPEALKKQGRELMATVSAEAKASASPEQYKKVQEWLTDFPAVVDMEVDRLQQKAHERVDSNQSFVVNKAVLERRVLHEKLDSPQMKKSVGDCQFVARDTEPASATDVQLSGDSKHAYVIVIDDLQNPASLYYINQVTNECKQICVAGSKEMDALVSEMKEGDAMNSLEVAYKRARFEKPLQTPKKEGEELKFYETTKLTSFQEERLKKLSGHVRQSADMDVDLEVADWRMASEAPPTPGWKKILPERLRPADAPPAGDWKKILPIPNDDPLEELTRQKEEKNLGSEIARDEAMKRLKERKDDNCTYDYPGAKFNIRRVKEEDGSMAFYVTFLNQDTTAGRLGFIQRQEAMAALIQMCHQQNPESAVVLSCDNARGNRYYIKNTAKDLKAAIVAAEKERERGIFIGIKLDASAKAILAAAGDKELEARAKSLYDSWSAHQQQLADQEKIHAVKEKSAASKLLAEAPSKGDLSPRGLSAEGMEIFPESATKEENFEKLKIAVGELEAEASRIDVVNKSIQDQLNAVEKKINEPEVKSNPEKLKAHADKIKELQAAQAIVDAEYKKLETAKENYTAWIENPQIKKLVGDNPAGVDAKEHAELWDEKNPYSQLKEQVQKVGTVLGTEKAQVNAKLTAVADAIQNHQAEIVKAQTQKELEEREEKLRIEREAKEEKKAEVKEEKEEKKKEEEKKHDKGPDGQQGEREGIEMQALKPAPDVSAAPAPPGEGGDVEMKAIQPAAHNTPGHRG